MMLTTREILDHHPDRESIAAGARAALASVEYLQVLMTKALQQAEQYRDALEQFDAAQRFKLAMGETDDN